MNVTGLASHAPIDAVQCRITSRIGPLQRSSGAAVRSTQASDMRLVHDHALRIGLDVLYSQTRQVHRYVLGINEIATVLHDETRVGEGDPKRETRGGQVLDQAEFPDIRGTNPYTRMHLQTTCREVASHVGISHLGSSLQPSRGACSRWLAHQRRLTSGCLADQ